MTDWKLNACLLMLSFSQGVTTESAEPPRLGGPYKLLAADFTGDGIADHDGDGTFKPAVTTMRGFRQTTDGFDHEQP